MFCQCFCQAAVEALSRLCVCAGFFNILYMYFYSVCFAYTDFLKSLSFSKDQITFKVVISFQEMKKCIAAWGNNFISPDRVFFSAKKYR